MIKMIKKYTVSSNCYSDETYEATSPRAALHSYMKENKIAIAQVFNPIDVDNGTAEKGNFIMIEGDPEIEIAEGAHNYDEALQYLIDRLGISISIFIDITKEVVKKPKKK